MAFPLTYCDENGVVTRYPWQDYPMLVARAEPVQWVADPAPIAEPRTITVIRVWCGPAADRPQTYAEWLREGLQDYMQRQMNTGWQL